MVIVNAFKLMFSNLSMVWKLLLYYLIVSLIAAALFFAFIVPVVSDLVVRMESTGFFSNINLFFTQFFTMDSALQATVAQLRDNLDEIVAIFAENYASVIVSASVLVAIFLCFRYLSRLSEYPMMTVLSGYMSEQSRHSFTGTFVKTLGKSSAMQAAITLLSFLVDAVIVILLFLFSGFALRMMGVFALTFISAATILLVSLKLTFFSLWRPYIAVAGLRPVKALSVSMAQAVSNFFRIFTQVLFGVFMIVVFNVAAAFFTCGAGLVVSLPATVVILNLFQLVLYYTLNNKRYYTDYQTVTMSKMEVGYYSVEEFLQSQSTDSSDDGVSENSNAIAEADKLTDAVKSDTQSADTGEDNPLAAAPDTDIDNT